MPHLDSVHRDTARLVVPLALVLCLGACTGSSGEPTAGSPGATTSSAAPSPTAAAVVPTKHLVGRVAGRLPGPRRRQLVRRAGPVVDGWLDAAFAGGTYPREIEGAWEGFTAGAARRARGDRAMTSLAGISERIDDVRVTKRAVRWTVLAPAGRPVGATARLTLDLHTSGEVRRKVTLRGRLALTRVRERGRDQWRIFSYDLSRGER